MMLKENLILSPCTHGLIFAIALAVIIVTLTKKFLMFVSIDEQLVIEGLTNQTIINGPKTVFVNPIITKHFEVRKALSLGPSDYCIIKNILSGEKHLEVGPKLVQLRHMTSFRKIPTTTSNELQYH